MLADGEMIGFVATARPEAALVFYRDVLGFALAEDTPFALVFSAGGRMLRVQKVGAFEPARFTALGWRVDDIAGEVDALAAKGVAFLRPSGLPQDERGVWTTPDGSKVAWFQDPDGNTLSLTEFAGG